MVSQLALPPRRAEAAPGSSTASAGSAPPPAVSTIQSFQPDLFTGRATTSIPIAVPPGRKGMQPSLGLSYSSSSRNSWVGVGWGLDLGFIERNTKDGVPKYDSTDAFTFMFQGVASELVRIADGTYRAKDEGLFLRVEDKSLSGWEVRDKSGTRYFFGQTAASQVESLGRAFRWGLDQVIDVNGNSLTITYVKDQSQLYPSQIRYTGHEPTGLAPANQVDFILENRPDVEISYRSGYAVTTAKRLTAIETRSTIHDPPSLVLARRYALGYRASARTGRSLLDSITQVGHDGLTSLPATRFTYQEDAPAYTVSSSGASTSVVAWNLRKAGLDTGNDNFGCVNPYAGLPWGSPTVVSSSADLGCAGAAVSSDGTITLNACQDQFVHAYTWVYASSARTIALQFPRSNDVEGCVWREDAGGVTRLGGTNEAISVSLSAGWSQLHITAYHEHQGWDNLRLTGGLATQVDVMSPSQFLKPQLTGDVDGNGTNDLITFDAITGTWAVSRGQSFGTSPAETWLTSFGNTGSVPVLGDWDGDGLTDIAIVNGSTWRFARSTSSSFQADVRPSISTASGTPLTGDFNGDGLVDLGEYSAGTWEIWLNASGTFVRSSALALTLGSSEADPVTGDFNGDGLTDVGIVRRNAGDWLWAFSTGNGFISNATWLRNFGPNLPHTTADFNGDGITDVAYYDRGSGQVVFLPLRGTSYDPLKVLPFAFSLRSPDDSLQVGDLNGDGAMDLAVLNSLTGRSEMAQSRGSGFADLLIGMDNGLGGATSLAYQPSSQLNNTLLPFILPVVASSTISDGMNHRYATTYSYAGGFYDGPTKEFRGFASASVRDVDGNVSSTTFLQDFYRKGRPSVSETRDASGNLWTRSEQTWTTTEPFPGVHFVKLEQTESVLYDGDATFKRTRSRFAYDAYGNITRTDADGEVDAAGDERAGTTAYVYNESAWILNKPSLTQTLDAGGQVVAQRRFTYDGPNLAKEEEWLSEPGAQSPEQWFATTLTYDAYGNVKTVKDALGRVTTNTYDASGTYLIEIKNALNHTRALVYDPRTGAVISSTDANGVTSTTEYDVLGRVTKVIGPTDTSSLPTISYEYILSSVPITTVTRTRINSGQTPTIDVSTFMDGLGRTIQTRTPAEDSTKQIVTGAVEFNARGQVAQQWVPYLDEFSMTYVATGPPGHLATVSYTYDPPGRLLTTTNADGSTTHTQYDDWSVTGTDANEHQTRHTNDAYGRLIKAEELNETETYTTTYEYDTLNNLTQVTDTKGNITRITYDSLGRKRSMDDPDMGHWSYEYDPVDNLTKQTDARGVVTNFSYDELNRLQQKSYTIPSTLHLPPSTSVSYTYDNPAKSFAKGKLTEISDGSGSSSFEYDTLGRLIKESKTIDSTTHTVHRTYDLPGRLVTLTYPDTDVASYTYNNQGGIETVDVTSATRPLSHLVTDVQYNAAGQMLKIAYGNGVVSDYSYDPQTLRLNHLATWSPGHSATLQDFSYDFDAVGNVKSITDRVHTGTQTFEYDDLNRLTRAQGAYGDLQYAYDPLGNMINKEGVAMTYGLADRSKPHAVTSTSSFQPPASSLQLTYDANGNMLTKSSSSITQSLHHSLTDSQYVYDAENRLVEVQAPQAEDVTVTFHPGWNFFSLPVILEDGSITKLLPTFSRDFDQVVRMASTFDLPPSTHLEYFFGDPEFDDFSTLDYGTAYQLYCTASAPVIITFSGKLPSKPFAQSLEAGWHLLPTLSLEPSALSRVFGGLDTDHLLAFDATAQTLKPATTAEANTAYWVHLRTAGTFAPSLPRDPTTRFLYDGDGGRVKSITAAGPTTFLGELFEKDPTGKTTKYVFAGSQRLAAITQPASAGGPGSPEPGALSALRFYHTDHLGSSNVITDSAGALVQLEEYTPYGSSHRHEGTANVPQKFTGQRFDASTGLYYYHARYYDPELGRFISPDAFIQNPFDPQSLNRYSYVRNNPLRYTDPSGNFLWIPFLIAAAKAILIAAATFAAFNVGFGVATGQITTWTAAGHAALAGAAAGATFAAGAIVVGPAIAGTLLGQLALIGASGAVGGGVGNGLAGGSFLQGAFSGAVGAVATFGVVKGIGATVGRTAIGQAIGRGLSRAFQPVTNAFGNAYAQTQAALGRGGAVAGSGSGTGALKGRIRVGMPSEQGSGTDTIYRGVSKDHPGFRNAQRGIVLPRGGPMDAIAHNEGYTNSPFTSWSANRNVAESFAGKGGVVLEKQVPWNRTVWSPDAYNENEVLIQGPVLNADVTQQ
ncbi:MAG: VCBS repeat-containing protein [Candidatus Omnitrophica bacterium]|nr:VCBS repeat-containing protein [Candidatus Omnitrophota bacterium]